MLIMGVFACPGPDLHGFGGGPPPITADIAIKAGRISDFI